MRQAASANSRGPREVGRCSLYVRAKASPLRPGPKEISSFGTRDEGEGFAASIAKLPMLLKKGREHGTTPGEFSDEAPSTLKALASKLDHRPFRGRFRQSASAASIQMVCGRWPRQQRVSMMRSQRRSFKFF